MVLFWSLSENDKEKVYESYFMVIYSFKDDLDSLYDRKKKNQEYLSLRKKNLNWYILMSILKNNIFQLL